MNIICENSDLIVFSHLRWNFVFQRPQHLLSRFVKYRRVFFIEEPIFKDIKIPTMKIENSSEGVVVATPHLPESYHYQNNHVLLATMIDQIIDDENICNYSVWYYTPMSLPFTRHLTPKHVLFDVMDELSLFKGAPPILMQLENELFKKADVVFTGGQSLFEAKKHRHANIHAFPSSIDKSHFAQARTKMKDPVDQSFIPYPRIGFFGVIDERTNINLLKEMAQLKPDYQFVMIGPVVKIDPESLPQARNIHYLGQKSYKDLPSYLSNWECAMMPFELNDSTRFISPTKTPEFLAAGKPVVSTSIRDVVRPYGEMKLVHIADTATDFVARIELAIEESRKDTWINKVDHFLSDISWDVTWQKIAALEKKLSQPKLLRPTASSTTSAAPNTSRPNINQISQTPVMS